MVTYNETANISLKLSKKFTDSVVYNVECNGGLIVNEKQKFCNIRFVEPRDLNSKQNLFGGTLLTWFDLDTAACVYQYMTEYHKATTVSVLNFTFKKPANLGDRIKSYVYPVHLSKSTITMKAVFEKTNGLEWEYFAHGYVTLCCIEENGKSIPLPTMKVDIDELKSSSEWEIVEKYKELARKS